MEWIDWIMLAAAGTAGGRHCRLHPAVYSLAVADFMAGGRAAGRYLICNAKGEAGSGVANTLSKFQPILISGFILSWWDISVPVSMIFAMFGFVVYRYRQTRAMTLGQFFEMRYSRNFRLFAGMLGFVAGILNYGIFPAVSSQFFVYFLDLPQQVQIGHIAVPTKVPHGALLAHRGAGKSPHVAYLVPHWCRRKVLIMAGYLSIAMWMMTVGGQITLMVTHCVEGILIASDSRCRRRPRSFARSVGRR